MDNDIFHDQLLGILEDAVEALKAKAEAPVSPPRVNVDVAPPDAPVINVEVRVPEAAPVKPPTVNVAAPVNKPCAYTITVTERDNQNFIRRLSITPVK